MAKRNIDIIGKEIEIYKVKLLLFMAIASGSWVYIVKFDNITFIVLLIFTFIVSSFGIYFNVLKLSDLQIELKRLKHD